MRVLRDIRSDSVTLVDHPPGAAASIALVPFSAMLLLCWLGTPTWGVGRLLVTALLGGVIATVALLAWPRQRVLRIPPKSELCLETSLEGEDPYRVLLLSGRERTLLLEHDNPARVLAEARRIAHEASATLTGPAWFAEPCATANRGWQPPNPAVAVIGLSSQGQLRTAWATLGGAAFTLVVFLVSVKAEAGVSLLSAALPLLSVAVTALIGAGLCTARVHATLGPTGLRAGRVLFGRQTSLLDVRADTILSVHAVGHAPHPERHVLVDTREGPQAFPLAGEAARRLVAQGETARTPPQAESILRATNRTPRDPIAETSP